MKLHITLLSCLISIACWGQEPEPRVWLRGDVGVDTLQWSDQSGNQHHFMPAPGMLMPRTAWMNFNPVLLGDPGFRGLGCSLDSLGFLQHTAFLVYQSATQQEEQGFFEIDLDGQHRIGLTSRQIHGLGSAIAFEEQAAGTPILHAVSQRWVPGQADSSSAEVWLGRYDSLAYHGAIAEFLLFPKAMSRAGMRRWQTYLALKYAISMGKFHYVSSAGDTVWNARTNYTYCHSIAGIARDDRFSLYQRQSASQSDIISIGAGMLADVNERNGSILPEGGCLVWGHNDEPLLTESTGFLLDSLIYLPLLRHWRMQVTGAECREIPTTIAFQLPSYLCFPGTEPVLIIEPQGGPGLAMTGVRIVTADSTDTEAGIAWFSEVQWDTDGNGHDLFTLAITGSGTQGNPDMLSAIPMVTLYPNPSPGEFNLSIRLRDPSRITVRIWDSEGSLLSRRDIPRTEEHLYQGFLRVPGVYLIGVETRHEAQTLRLVIN